MKENTEKKSYYHLNFFFFLSLFLLVLLLNCCTYFCSVHNVELFWMSLLRKLLIRSSPLCISQTFPILQMIVTKFQTHTTDLIFARSCNLFFICQNQGNSCKSSKINCVCLKKTFINWPGLTSLPNKKSFCLAILTYCMPSSCPPKSPIPRFSLWLEPRRRNSEMELNICYNNT